MRKKFRLAFDDTIPTRPYLRCRRVYVLVHWRVSRHHWRSLLSRRPPWTHVHWGRSPHWSHPSRRHPSRGHPPGRSGHHPHLLLVLHPLLHVLHLLLLLLLLHLHAVRSHGPVAREPLVKLADTATTSARSATALRTHLLEVLQIKHIIFQR